MEKLHWSLAEIIDNLLDIFQLLFIFFKDQSKDTHSPKHPWEFHSHGFGCLQVWSVTWPPYMTGQNHLNLDMFWDMANPCVCSIGLRMPTFLYKKWNWPSSTSRGRSEDQRGCAQLLKTLECLVYTTRKHFWLHLGPTTVGSECAVSQIYVFWSHR